MSAETIPKVRSTLEVNELLPYIMFILSLFETASPSHVQSLETPVAALLGEESSTYSCRSCNVSKRSVFNVDNQSGSPGTDLV